MNGELVGKVTTEEKNEMLTIYERKLGIEELMSSFGSQFIPEETKDSIIEKMIAEAGKNQMKSQSWWDRMYQKYSWKMVEGKNWHIDFDSCEIYLA